MLLSGFVSILQITFLPGFIWIEIFKIKTDSPIQRWLYIFSFSLFINYGLVTVLTLLSVYTFYVIWGVVILELLLLLLFCRAQLSKLFSKISFRYVYIKCCQFLKNNSPADRVILVLSGLVILFYCSAFFANIGTIFYFIDTVNNYEWNRWAIDFANNILPKYSSHFPQLLPANWSISYVMIDKTDVHFFPKAFMPLFFINNLLIFLDLSLPPNPPDKSGQALPKEGGTEKLLPLGKGFEVRLVFLFGLIIYGLFAPIIYSLVFIVDGNADLPVSFFAFLTFYSFIKKPIPNPFSKVKPHPYPSPKGKGFFKALSFGEGWSRLFLFAAMAAATKLAGFYTFTVTVLFLSIFLLANRKNISFNEILKLIMFAIFIIGISLFWYFKTPEVMVSGLHQPEYLPEGYSSIALRALKLMYNNWGLPVFAFFIITITASLISPSSTPSRKEGAFGNQANSKLTMKVLVRYLTLVMVVIPIIIWMLKYSADFRNLSFVVPFLCFSSAAGLFKIISLSPNPFPKGRGFRKSAKLADDEESKTLKVNADEHSSLPDTETLSKKNKLILLLISALSGIMLLIFISDKFYLILLNIYEFIHKYYFQSNRIIYFIEYGLLLHVDFYQRVLIALSIILIILPIFIIIKIRLRTVLLLILISVPLLNFTIITEKNILEHQTAAFNKVDARNYYEWLKMILKPNPYLKDKSHSHPSPKGKGVFRSQDTEINIHTNFKAIMSDKVPREINFYYMGDVSKTSLEKIKEKNYQIFLKWGILSSETVDFIKSKIDSKEYKLLFNDSDFTFFIINPE